MRTVVKGPEDVTADHMRPPRGPHPRPWGHSGHLRPLPQHGPACCPTPCKCPAQPRPEPRPPKRLSLTVA